MVDWYVAKYGKINTDAINGRCPHLKTESFVEALGGFVTSEARPSQGTWCGEAKCCGSHSCQRSKANCSQAIDSGLLLVKYTLQSRLAQRWRECHKPHGVDCAVSHRNYGIWAGFGMSCSFLVSASWLVIHAGEQISEEQSRG